MNIIELAKQAGFVIWSKGERQGKVDWASEYDDELERFAALITAQLMSESASICAEREPVAWVRVYEDGGYFIEPNEKMLDLDTATVHDLYAAPAEEPKGYIAAYYKGREDMREEAAKVCLQTGIKHPQQTGQEACALAIRGLK